MRFVEATADRSGLLGAAQSECEDLQRREIRGHHTQLPMPIIVGRSLPGLQVLA